MRLHKKHTTLEHVGLSTSINNDNDSYSKKSMDMNSTSCSARFSSSFMMPRSSRSYKMRPRHWYFLLFCSTTTCCFLWDANRRSSTSTGQRSTTMTNAFLLVPTVFKTSNHYNDMRRQHCFKKFNDQGKRLPSSSWAKPSLRRFGQSSYNEVKRTRNLLFDQGGMPKNSIFYNQRRSIREKQHSALGLASSSPSSFTDDNDNDEDNEATVKNNDSEHEEQDSSSSSSSLLEPHPPSEDPPPDIVGVTSVTTTVTTKATAPTKKQSLFGNTQRKIITPSSASSSSSSRATTTTTSTPITNSSYTTSDETYKHSIHSNDIGDKSVDNGNHSVIQTGGEGPLAYQDFTVDTMEIPRPPGTLDYQTFLNEHQQQEDDATTETMSNPSDWNNDNPSDWNNDNLDVTQLSDAKQFSSSTPSSSSSTTAPDDEGTINSSSSDTNNMIDGSQPIVVAEGVGPSNETIINGSDNEGTVSNSAGATTTDGVVPADATAASSSSTEPVPTITEETQYSTTTITDRTGSGNPIDSTAKQALAAADDALSISPEQIDILPLVISQVEERTKQDAAERFLKSSYGQYPFVNMFRSSAIYIAQHRNSVMVFHIGGELLEWGVNSGSSSASTAGSTAGSSSTGVGFNAASDNTLFGDLMNDIALCWLLGTKVVIVVGCRCFVDRRLVQMGKWPPERHGGVRVTDGQTLRIVKEEAGFVRFEVERQLARALRKGLSFVGGGDQTPPNVVSGNFYSAQPFGIVDGIDHLYTGLLRRVEKEKIRQAHHAGDIVLLTNLGASPSGELFNVNSESLASGVAGSLQASKIIFFSLAGSELRDVDTDKHIQGLRYSDAERLLAYHGVTVRRGGYAVMDTDTEQHPAVIECLLKIGWSLMALKNGVRRAHIIPPKNGALLQELYTRDGCGLLVSGDIYEGIRRANVNDVAGLFELIQPLVKAGILAQRTKTSLEEDILSYFVYTRDNLIVACAQLHRYEGGFAEIGCLVVDKNYRSQGRGDAMLGYLERLCIQSQIPNVFVLSTQTMQFFVERGFTEVPVEALPPSRQTRYNYARRSKIYMKNISDDRDLDVEELLWNK